jgi:hypothetical protein
LTTLLNRLGIRRWDRERTANLENLADEDGREIQGGQDFRKTFAAEGPKAGRLTDHRWDSSVAAWAAELAAASLGEETMVAWAAVLAVDRRLADRASLPVFVGLRALARTEVCRQSTYGPSTPPLSRQRPSQP